MQLANTCLAAASATATFTLCLSAVGKHGHCLLSACMAYVSCQHAWLTPAVSMHGSTTESLAPELLWLTVPDDKAEMLASQMQVS